MLKALSLHLFEVECLSCLLISLTLCSRNCYPKATVDSMLRKLFLFCRCFRILVGTVWALLGNVRLNPMRSSVSLFLVCKLYIFLFKLTIVVFTGVLSTLARLTPIM